MKIVKILFVLILVSVCLACSVFKLPPDHNSISTKTRFKELSSVPKPKLTGHVQVYFNKYLVPYIVAENDLDAAKILGIIHAHLRLGQMETLKRLALGRLSESASFATHDIDLALRMLSIKKSAEETYQRMPASTKSWLGSYAAGINHYKKHTKTLHPEMQALGINNHEEWLETDSIAISILTGADINWFHYIKLLKIRDSPEWEQIWSRKKSLAYADPSSFDLAERIVTQTILGVAKAGSNSVAVHASKSDTGGALIANDPHLGFQQPNPWIIAGLKSPSFHIVGMLAPGVPVFGFGRTPDLAWGGTNMRAASSSLVDVTDLPKKQRTEKIKTRFWFDKKATIRETEFGPVITDSELFQAEGVPELSLRWIANENLSDEITAFLKAAQAKNWEELRAAFKNYALPALNIIFADRRGNIGHLLATISPNRKLEQPKDLWQSPAENRADWQEFSNITSLPMQLNPKNKIIASSNNKPANTKPSISWYYSPSNRADRAIQFLSQQKKVTLKNLITLQSDTYSKDSCLLNQLIIDHLENSEIQKILKGWDCKYEADSKAAYLFESLFVDLYDLTFEHLQINSEKDIYNNSYKKRALLIKLKSIAQPTRKDLIKKSVQMNAGNYAAQTSWGDQHQIKLAHLLDNLPIIGKYWRTGQIKTGGTQETFMKAQHEFTKDPHTARFGSQSRHISDLADPDANYFVLLGGQDGFFGSQNFNDQVKLWQNHEYIKVPLSVDKIQQNFPYQIKY